MGAGVGAGSGERMNGRLEHPPSTTVTRAINPNLIFDMVRKFPVEFHLDPADEEPAATLVERVNRGFTPES